MHLSGVVASSSTTGSIASCTGAVDSTIVVGAIDSGSTTIVAGSIAAAELESITATRVAVGLEFPDSATKLAVDPKFLDSAIRVGSNLEHSD